ncbi:hypothetical protein FMUND_12392 [Fusarium mundagurra]|uniref:Uncharacterized protein n=1 Tax=Fusarium mundagurra TaxID=1567541 RepID=A0A8H5Y2X8_9HYPO|nr:hypothetical protein FMUND_12392 [Fusarium mundagurra]
MESCLLCPDGLKRMPMIFGQGGKHINQALEGPAGTDYGVEVRQKGKKKVLSFGSSQWLGPRGTGKAAQQQDYFYTDGTGAMMCLNIPEGFASVLSDRAGYFRLAILSVGETPHCVAAFKITNGDPARKESIGGGRCGLAYNVQPEEISSRDSTTGKEHQTVTQKVEPSYGKVRVMALSIPLFSLTCM